MNYVSTIGFFDGVHRGHQYLLQGLTAEAAHRSLGAKVFTFGVHPRQVLTAGFRPQLLTTLEEKLALISEMGIKECRVLDFDSSMAAMTAEDFMRKVLKPEGVSVLLMGYDHHFGSDRADFEACSSMGSSMGLEVLRENSFAEGTSTFSSSLVRKRILQGDVIVAASLLGRPYALSGIVVEGHRVGRSLGFPTANLLPDSQDKIIPAHGAYAVRAVAGGRSYCGMTNIGTRPTLQNGEDVSIETHLFDCDADLYGRTLQLQFLHHLREEQHFDNIDELKTQLAIDAERARKLLKP
ncbi:MAG: riboflavin biosynthesis protein RibF [Alloprevotella sp.]|nr:riboflavin biosynthesis protein RibF [Alloprevotella sp.]